MCSSLGKTVSPCFSDMFKRYISQQTSCSSYSVSDPSSGVVSEPQLQSLYCRCFLGYSSVINIVLMKKYFFKATRSNHSEVWEPEVKVWQIWFLSRENVFSDS